MATALDLFPSHVSIGFVVVNGQRLPVQAGPDFQRALGALMVRVGGPVAPSITEIVTTINRLPQTSIVLHDDGEDDEPCTPMPGPMGRPGDAGVSIRGLDGEDGEDGAMAVGSIGPAGPMAPLTPGADGEDGEPGMMFLQVSNYRASVDQTASRALNTTYTNSSTLPMLVGVTVRCAVTLAGGNAFIQGASPVGTAASGQVGIEAGLLGEDNTFQLSFVVGPGEGYRVNTSTTNGTATMGSWFEFPL